MKFLIDNLRWIAVGFLLHFASSVGQTFFISIFAGEIMREFAISDGQWGRYYSIGTGISAALMFATGGVVDHYRARQLVPILLGGSALACIVMANISSALLLPLAVFLLRFCGQGMTPHLSSVTIARWFLASRGRAMAFVGLGFSVGEAGLPSLFVVMLDHFSWRQLWYFAALIPLASAFISYRLLAEERTPQSYRQNEDIAGMRMRHWNRRQVVAHGLFWLILPTLTLSGIFLTATFFQQVHIAEVKGWTHAQTVALFPLYTSCVIVSSFVFGWAIDRFGARNIMALIPLPMALGFTVLALSKSLFAGAIGLMLLGIMQGGSGVVSTIFWAEFYGTRYLGSIKSMGMAFIVLGSALGPVLTGGLIDLGIDYVQQMPYIAAYCGIVSILAYLGIRKFGS